MSKIKYIGKCLFVRNDDEDVLVVGDLHLGYEGGKNVQGVDLNNSLFRMLKDEFDNVFSKIIKEGDKIDKIILLGDLKQGFSRVDYKEREFLNKFFEYLVGKLDSKGKIIVVRGNHDNYLMNMLIDWNIELKDYYVLNEDCYLHGDKEFVEIYDASIKRWIIGHGHPAVRLSDGTKSEKYKCFLEGKFKDKEVIIVPSFVEYNEGSDPREYDLGFPWVFNLEEFKVRIIDNELNTLDFGKLGDI
ncbi:hypothetical protein COU54_04745 [Candidatus Pacearchaeota archaeon CG10_big_fil_rev_8_21_14_0_10_31_24]|nr:MAG: hypothetical protein COU54_04745 [Candidatus Pacearchaeota archaeon CG10_big_fil_rev_8_21_14_0_10_31_24]